MKEAIQETMNDGGMVLWALLLLAFIIYGLLGSTWSGLRRARARAAALEISPTEPAELVSGKMSTFELNEIAWVGRRIPFLGVLVAAAPLLGLMGTVAGMLKTFSGLASANGATPIESVSAGISQALVTTQAGLVVAVPAAFLLALLHRGIERTHLDLQGRWHGSMASRNGTLQPTPER